MGITIKHKIKPVDQEAFNRTDYRIADFCFQLHNELGRLHDEKIYQRCLQEILRQNGMPAEREVRIAVSYDTFVKHYAIDLLVGGSMIYELKAADSIVERHRAQLINYLLLGGLNHGKIVNFRPTSVESEFVSTRIDKEARYRYEVDCCEFKPQDAQSKWLLEMIELLLNEWGSFLATELYYEAIIHFAGGAGQVMKPIPIITPSGNIGHETFSLLNEVTAFEFTSLKKMKNYARHLRKKLHHTSLSTIQWVNFNGHEIKFITLANEAH